jgi:L-threonylcarbamoyladenylate synthase
MCPNLDGIMEGNVIFSKGSTIIDCSSDDIKILREGPITIEQINEIVNYNLRKKVIKL